VFSPSARRTLAKGRAFAEGRKSLVCSLPGTSDLDLFGPGVRRSFIARGEDLMLMPGYALGEGQEAHGYLQDDVVRGLRMSLVSVLSAALVGDQASSGYLKGVFALARSQASLYGIPWCDLVASLRQVPELWNLCPMLQDGCKGF
jgi:hypothetical protein